MGGMDGGRGRTGREGGVREGKGEEGGDHVKLRGQGCPR